MSPSRGVIFDLDGTLADTLATIGSAVNHALGELDLPPHPLEAYRTMVGEGIYVLADRVLPDGAEDRKEQLLERIRSRYRTHVLDGTRLYDGVEELLGELTSRGVRLGVLSNKPHALTVATLEGLGIAAAFGAVLGERPEVPRKPDPAGARRVLADLGLEAGRVLYVGDTPTDMKTAHAAGMRAVGVTWGFRSRAELAAAGADVLVERAAEILDLLPA